MLSSFRRLSKSSVGTAVMVIVLVLIIIGFAMGDMQNILSGNLRRLFRMAPEGRPAPLA